ncbi:heavy-metal-associated domain-containing protein [Bacteroides sp. 224]|uniref:heavy-metal-associated domain-containing protein n=1 Tax=Bacteroides sp. 224 TaxID=2302936 RepID=UPI0013D25D5A|nr:heavy-metal-associated domain-containing protein [Bacteroides sp. 224]NDV64503.1 cation transporter [Bacteroides sp. 224]
MKKKLIMAFAILIIGISTAFAKELRVVTFKVQQMECANCEKKVKTNIRFEKGLKELSTDLKEKTVTITYDSEKTDVKKLQEGFKKFKYEAVLVEDKVKESKK